MHSVENSPLSTQIAEFRRDWNLAHQFIQTSKSEYSAQYDEILKTFSRAVFETISSYDTIHECSIMIAFLYNEKECIETICKTISNALTADKNIDKTAIYKQQWLKEHFVKNNKKILAIPLQTEQAKDSNINNSLLYDIVIKNVISIEMLKLQKILKLKLENEIKMDPNIWKQIKLYDILKDSTDSTDSKDTEDIKDINLNINLVNDVDSESINYKNNINFKKNFLIKNHASYLVVLFL